jgi:hypothetical protein
MGPVTRPGQERTAGKKGGYARVVVLMMRAHTWCSQTMHRHTEWFQVGLLQELDAPSFNTARIVDNLTRSCCQCRRLAAGAMQCHPCLLLLHSLWCINLPAVMTVPGSALYSSCTMSHAGLKGLCSKFYYISHTMISPSRGCRTVSHKKHATVWQMAMMISYDGSGNHHHHPPSPPPPPPAL